MRRELERVQKKIHQLVKNILFIFLPIRCIIVKIDTISMEGQGRNMFHQKEVTIDRPLRSNDIATIVSVSNEFQSEIHIRKENKQVNLKSTLGVFSLRLAKNDRIVIICHGPDSEEALRTVVSYFVAEIPYSSAARVR